MDKRSRKFFSLLLSLALVLTTALTGYSPAVTSAAVETGYVETATAVSTESTLVSQALSNGLAEKVEDGVILHCWNWSFDTIKNEIPDIAAAGFTAIQTSPIQMNKDGASGVSGTGDWWKFYQPINFEIGNALGTRDQFKAMCDVAHANGVKVIVDVVANHLANNSTGANTYAERCTQIPSYIRDNNDYWHSDNYSGSSDSDRYQMTHAPIGMPDLNTSSTGLQDIIISFLNDAQDCGADGFRFDAAKHIETPSDSGFASQFWSRVASSTKAKNSDVFLYGEILNTAGPGNYSDVQKYTPYIKVTNNLYGHTVQDSVKDWKASYVKTLHGYNTDGTKIFGDADDGDDWVLWNESHDTFAGEYGDSTRGFSEEQMIYAWCAVAARYPVALYFSRPQSQAVSGSMGVHSSAYKDKRIVEMNFFHNYFAGESEYASNYENMLVVERGTSGVAIVNYDRSGASVNIKMNRMADGEYKDQVSGNTFKVSGGYLSGSIGSTGVAVIYNKTDNKQPKATISQEGGSFSSDTLSLTIGLSNATSGTYKIGSSAAVTFTSTKTITIGDGMDEGDSVNVVLTATDGTNNFSKTYTFTKSGGINLPDVPDGYKRVFFKNSGNWSTINYYNWISGTTTSAAAWPGSAMSVCDESNGIYYADVNINAGYNSIIFNNGSAQTDDLTVPTDSKNMFTYGSGWSVYTPPASKGKVIVTYVDESGTAVADSTTLTGTVGSAYTTSAKNVSGYSLKTTPSNATGKYTSSTITVKYVYSKVSSGPSVTSSLADGSSFKTETTTITLTLSNATSGTYTIDNGIKKSFTGSTTVKIGEGKIADSNITVAVTATNGTTTNSQTFTYKKVFNGTVNETTTNAAAVVDTDVTTAATLYNSKLDSQYQTKVATGSKTITVDGTISDWSSDMLIAQGAANDDPRVYRPNSMYEVGIDLYALYATYDSSNLYLMWEMTNVQDVVAPSDDYPLTQGTLFNGHNYPFFIAIDTRDSSSKIGNDCMTSAGATLWNTGISFKQDVNRIIAISTNAANGPFVYGGTSAGLNATEIYDSDTAGVTFKYGMGILSSKVMGIDGAYGTNNGRVVGDMTSGATYVDFNTKGHDSASKDFHYEMSIPLDKLGTTASKIAANGLGIELVATMGKSGMDCLPYDVTMNDNADLDDSAGSQENNSFEKSDEDVLTVAMGSLVKSSGSVVGEDLELNFGADRSAPQATGTALSLLGKASGGSGTYSKYQYYVNGSLIGTKTSETAVSWTPSAAGKYVIKCVVTDSEGTTVTSSKYFTVEGTSEVVGIVPTLTAGDKQIKATWSAVSGATNYRVFTYLNSKYTKVTDTTSTSYTITGLTNGTKYGVYVIPYIDGSWVGSGTSYIRYATPVASSYVTPTLTAGDKQIKATWSAVSGASNYRVFTYLNGTYTKIAETTSTSYTITGLTNGTKYGVYVIAYVGSKWVGSSTSYIRYATPAASSYVTPTLTAGDKQIKATWSKVSGATNYRVFTYLNNTYTKIGDTTSTSYTITGLTNGTKYGVYVIAYVGSKWVSSGTSYIRYATPVASVSTSFVTPKLTAGDKQIEVTWSAVSGATKYRVFKYINNAYTKVVDTTSTSYTITGLTNGTKYGVYVIAYVNGSWVGSGSDYVKYATPVASSYVTPTLTAGNAQIKATWSAVSGATNYRVFTYINGVYTKVGETTGKTYTIKGLANGIKYGVYVIAYVNGSWVGSGTSYIRYATPTA